MYYLGIDPGKKGAIVALKPHKDKKHEVLFVRNFKLPKCSSIHERLEGIEQIGSLISLSSLIEVGLPKIITIESQRGGKAANAAFEMGFNYAAILSNLKFPPSVGIQAVHPREWKLLYGISEKRQARNIAASLFDYKFTRMDQAEAALIGLWGAIKNERGGG